MRFNVYGFISAAVAVAVFLAMPAETARAAQPDSNAIVLTFSGPMIVPGVTLPAGKYRFEEADTSTTSGPIHIKSEDGTKHFATVMAIPVRRTDGKGDVVVKFAETDPGVAPAIRAWFPPGALTGHQFIYPASQAKSIADATKTLVLSADDDDLKAGELRESSIYVTSEKGGKQKYVKGDWDDLPRVVSGERKKTSSE